MRPLLVILIIPKVFKYTVKASLAILHSVLQTLETDVLLEYFVSY